MKIEGKVLKSIKKKMVEIEEITDVHQITITVDQSFLDVINAIGITNGNDRVKIGMTEKQSSSCYKFYHCVTDRLNEMNFKKNSDFEYVLVPE